MKVKKSLYRKVKTRINKENGKILIGENEKKNEKRDGDGWGEEEEEKEKEGLIR